MSDYWKKKLTELNKSTSGSTSQNYWDKKIADLEKEKKTQNRIVVDTRPRHEDSDFMDRVKAILKEREQEVDTIFDKERKEIDADIAPIRSKEEEDKILSQMTPTQRMYHQKSGGFPDLSTPWNEQVDAVTKMILEGTDTDYAQADKLMKQLKAQQQNLSLNETAKASEITELQGYYNQILVAKNAAILSKTKMDGSNKSVLQEMQELAEASGKEKKSRKEAVLKEMDKLGIPRDQYSLYTDDKNFQWGTFGDWAGSTALAGLNSAWLGIAKTLNTLTFQNPLTQKVVDFYQGSYDTYKHDADLAAEKLGGGAGWNFATDALEGTSGAVPSAVTAIMTMGGSTGGDLATKAAYAAGTWLEKIGITASNILKNPNFWFSVTRTLGSDYEEALNRGANSYVAALGATFTSLVNGVIEIGLDGGSGIQGLPDDLANGNKNALWAWFESILEETGEEGLQKFVTEVVTKTAYDHDAEILNPKEYAREMGIGGVAGAALGGGNIALNTVVNSYKQVEKSIKDKLLTADENAVVDRLVEESIAEKTKDGKELTPAEKRNIKKEIRRQLENGSLNIEKIEEILGGESYETFKGELENFFGSEDYKNYRKAVEEEEAIRQEWEELGKKGTTNLAEMAHFNDLHQQMKDIKANSQAEALRTKLTPEAARISQMRDKMRGEMITRVKDSRLAESYREHIRSQEKYTVDVNKYTNENARKTVQNILDSGMGDNSNAFHHTVEFLAKLSEHQGTTFSLTNNKQIKGTKHYKPGYIVNGFVSENGDITLNMDSPKALNTTVGHEITHVLEAAGLDTKFKDAVVNFAISKEGVEGYNARIKRAEQAYQGQTNTTPESEVVADLVGEYIFTDYEFVSNLAKTDQNVFQKAYDTVKYMAKIAVAGSKEARELLKAQRMFEKAYRENIGKENSVDGVKNSVSAVEKFGTTNSFAQAGFAMSDGRMLNLSQYGLNGVKHQRIEDIYDDTKGSDAVNRFIQEGNVRIKASSPGIEIGEKIAPTVSQLNTISRFINESLVKKGWFYLDITGADGNTIATVEYDEDASTEDILWDIKEYYNSGRVPKNTGVHYSLSENSNGKRLTDEQAEFFKNSKVRDENGNLMVLYHGTQNDFTVFDISRSGENYENDWSEYGEGIYLTPDKKTAEYYGENAGHGRDVKLMEAYANITNPFNVNDPVEFDISDLVEKYELTEFDERHMKRYGNRLVEFLQHHKESVRDYLTSKGYDGVWEKGLNGEVYQVVAYAENQIKNTDNTNPTSNPDIRYSLSEDTWSQIQGMQSEVNRLNDAIREFEASDAFKEQMKMVSEAVDAGDTDKGIKQYQRWIKESGYEDLLNKRNAMRDELESLRKNAEETRASEALEAERKAIEQSGLSEADYFRKQAVKEFGYTPYFYDAGYITTNGKMLNFSGEKGQHFGSRGEDHRAIGIIYAETNGTDALNRFVNDGNIRISPESPGIDLSATVEPTKEQYATIKKFVYQYADKGYFSIDISDKNGNVIGSLEYENRIYPAKIIDDLKHYYETGEIRQQSDIGKFHYSLSEDSQGRKLTTAQQEFFNDSKIVDADGKLKVMYHGTPNGDYSEFKSGTYFTDNKEYADRYQNPGASSISTGKTATAPKTFEVYLNIKKPFDIHDAEARRIYIEEYIKGGNALGIDPYLTDAEYAKINSIDWTEGEDLRDFLTENGYDYDGLVLDEGADGGYGDAVKHRGTSYMVFSPEQVKTVDNQNPTSSPDSQFSLSDANETPNTYGDYRVYGKDFGIPQNPLAEFAPVAETAEATPVQEAAPEVAPVQEATQEITQEAVPEDVVPVQEKVPQNKTVDEAELSRLLAENEALEEKLWNAVHAEDFSNFNQMAAEWDALQTRIAEVHGKFMDENYAPMIGEESEYDRLASLDDADAPPVSEVQPRGRADAVPLTKKVVADISREVRTLLGLSNNQMADLRSLIEEYSQSEFLDRDQLFADIKDKFGKYKADMYSDDHISDAKSYLRTVGLDVSESIKKEIADYANLMRRNRGRIRFSKSGMPVDSFYHELNAMFPDLFPDDIISPTDQFMQMVDVANTDSESVFEMPHSDETVWDAANAIIRGVTRYQQYQNERTADKHAKEAFDSLMRDADQYAPPVEEDIAPVMQTPVAETPVAPIEEAPTREYEAIRPEPQKPVVDDDIAPVMGDKLVRVDSNNGRPGEKQRKWVGTSTESEAVDRKVLPDDLNQDLIHYQPISNKKTLGNANAKLDRMGYEGSVAYLNGQFANNKVTLDDIALGERLIQEAVKRGDTKTAGDLIMDISILGTELGQKVQALSIIKRLTPEGQLRMLQRTVERGKAKGDKAYEGVELTQDIIDKILSVYGKDGTYDQDKLNEVVEEAKKQIADQMKVTAMDKVNAWRYLSMLGNPKTHIRNMVSNVAMRGTVLVKNAVARTIESIAPIENRTKTWKPATKEIKAFARKTAVEMQDIIAGDSKYSEDSSIKDKRDIFKTGVLNKVYEFNSDMLEKEDWWFSKPAFIDALSEYLTANGISTEEDIQNNPKVVEKAKLYATEQAQIATFRQYSWLASRINDIERHNAATQIAVGAVIPFKKTPINIAKAGLNYSPLGFAKTLTNDIAQVKKGNMEASELIDHLAQNMTGTALTLVGYLLASAGFVNGGGEDDKEGKYDYQLGEQSYSINIGGNTYSLSWLSPVAMPLFVGANAYEQLVEGKEWNGDVVVQTLAQTLDPLSEMSFLSGLNDVLGSYGSGMEKFAGVGETMAQNYITQFVPTLSSQIATVMDDTKRSTKVGSDSGFKFFDETINKLKLKIPGLRQTLEPSTDIWGNDIKQTEDVQTRAFETFIAPYAGKNNISTHVDEEIKSLYRDTGENGLIPAVPDNFVNFKGGKYEMSEAQFATFKKTYGQTAFNLMDKLFSTETYQNASSEDKADLVEKVYDYARDKAKLDFLREHGVSYTNAQNNGVDVYKENPIKGAIENDMMPDEYSFSRENPGKYKFFKANNITYSDYESADEDGKRAYTWAYENPDKYLVSKAVTDDLIEYRQYTSAINDIRADKTSSGKTISGSAKEKKIKYINSLDIDYGKKLILLKSEYPADDTYNREILDYLNSRSDISYEDEITILKELGFTVTADGRVYWD